MLRCEQQGAPRPRRQPWRLPAGVAAARHHRQGGRRRRSSSTAGASAPSPKTAKPLSSPNAAPALAAALPGPPPAGRLAPEQGSKGPQPPRSPTCGVAALLKQLLRVLASQPAGQGREPLHGCEWVPLAKPKLREGVRRGVCEWAIGEFGTGALDSSQALSVQPVLPVLPGSPPVLSLVSSQMCCLWII